MRTGFFGEGKSLAVVVLLWLFLGALRVHRFYLGHVTHGVVMLVSFLALCLGLPVLFLGLGLTGAITGEAGGWSFILSGMLGMALCSLWWFIDGLYVIYKFSSDR